MNIDIITQLETFADELQEYRYCRLLEANREATRKQKQKGYYLRTKLLPDVGRFRQLIKELTGEEKVPIYEGKESHTVDMWQRGLRLVFDQTSSNLVEHCTNVTREAIGKLGDDIRTGKRDAQTGELLTKAGMSGSESPSALFDAMQFHPRVIQVSESLFKTGNYASAILEVFKAVDNLVKEKTALSLNGQALMSKVFDENNPIIKLNDLLNQSDHDEQEGFKFLFKGATIGIRNPKAHDNVIQTDPYRTLEYLGLASLLMRRTEEGKLVIL